MVRAALLERPAVEDGTRREFIGALGAFAALWAVGCGDDSGRDSSSATTAASGVSTVTNKYGTYDVPTQPQRLVLMENRTELEVATALGLEPVAVGNFFTFTGGPVDWVAPWVPYRPNGEETVFKSFEVNIEQILALRPDLIISASTWLDGSEAPARSYDVLKEAAPVVPLGLADTWRTDLELVAGWLGRDEQLGASFRAFDDLRESIRHKHGDKLASTKVAMGSAEDPGLWLTSFDYGHDPWSIGPAATALAELGGQLMPFSDPSKVDGGWLSLSVEQLGELDGADGVLVWAPDSVMREALLSTPLWPNVPAVRAGAAVVSEQNVGSGHLYTIMECMRLWDQVYDQLG